LISKDFQAGAQARREGAGRAPRGAAAPAPPRARNAIAALGSRRNGIDGSHVSSSIGHVSGPLAIGAADADPVTFSPLAAFIRGRRPMINDLWYKNAIIYCLSVGAFMDSDGDGIGDFKGLMRRLDYLHGLGVTAIWLMPFQVSPQRDGRACPGHPDEGRSVPA